MQKFSWHSRWQSFKGDSTDEKDLIFSAKTSSKFQFTRKLDIFLANNISEQVCDFRMKASYRESNCDIFAGQSSTLIAQVKSFPVFLYFARKGNNYMIIKSNIICIYKEE